MKKTFLVLATLLLSYMGANAQQSEVEIANQETKTEKFLKECNFVREDQITSYKGKGLEIYGKIFTDLKSGKQVAAIEFFVKRKVFGQGEDLAAKPLGYLDIEHADDLITALEQILAMANNASKKDAYSISYTAPGGIDVYFSQGIKLMVGAETDPMVYFRKKWYGINEYGTRSVHYVDTEGTKVESLTKIIPVIKETKLIAAKEVKNAYTPQPKVIQNKVVQPTYTPVAENSIESVPVIETKAEESKAEEIKVEETKATDAIVETTSPMNIEDYKKQLNATLVKVVQKYNAQGLMLGTICKSYMQCGRTLIKSNSIEDLQTLDKLNSLAENLLDKLCMIDKKALEKQLSSQKTAEGMLEVFKSVM